MQRFIDATKMAVATGNWYAALSLALTMPDICGRLSNPTAGSQARFVAWFDKFLLKRYQAPVGANGNLHTFLCGSDCYALRCAFLHQGEFGIDDQRAQRALERFHFTAPRSGMFVHNNQVNNTLQLQIDAFCSDVCDAVKEWLAAVEDDTDVQGRMAKLANIGSP
jgi:hypothetical protein